jgi:UDP-MurNAc hydroxylase
MEITLISHASVVVRTDVSIWTDPWLFGKAFNDSWSLFPEPVLDESLYDSIDYLFISHEHPDHFHIPTLKSLPDNFKKRVKILFQENNSDKVINALNRLGYPNAIRLPHAKKVSLTDTTEVFCYQARSLDSALAESAGGETIVNLNDCELSRRDCRRIRRSVGKVDVVLNQFSIAGYSGFAEREKYLPIQAENVLAKMLANHRDLGAKVTMPFASFIYFSSEDNSYINDFANRPQSAHDYFSRHGEQMAVLFPGETYRIGSSHDSAASLEKFHALYSDTSTRPIEKGSTVALEDISEAFARLAAHLREKYPGLLLRRLKPVTVEVPDLKTTVRFSAASGAFEEVDMAEPDLIVNSQPLYFAFSFPYGVQTLGVSARYTLIKDYPNWRRYRILFSLNNAELYLKPRFLFTLRNLSFFWQRLPGAMNQFAYKLKVMR